jgi:hypothetical protein
MCVPRRRPKQNHLRKLLTRASRARSNLVPNLRPEFPRKLAPQSIATYARGMGACTLHTIPRNVESMTVIERRNLISVPPRKAERNPIL